MIVAVAHGGLVLHQESFVRERGDVHPDDPLGVRGRDRRCARGRGVRPSGHMPFAPVAVRRDVDPSETRVVVVTRAELIEQSTQTTEIGGVVPVGRVVPRAVQIEPEAARHECLQVVGHRDAGVGASGAGGLDANAEPPAARGRRRERTIDGTEVVVTGRRFEVAPKETEIPSPRSANRPVAGSRPARGTSRDRGSVPRWSKRERAGSPPATPPESPRRVRALRSARSPLRTPSRR